MLTQLVERILRLTVQIHPTPPGGTVEMAVETVPIQPVGMVTGQIQQTGTVETQVIRCQDKQSKKQYWR